MGSLTPGATFIYERDGGVVYAREVGQNERKPIGWMHTNDILEDAKMWLDIRRLAETNVALQNALNHAVTIYKIIKDDEHSKESTTMGQDGL